MNKVEMSHPGRNVMFSKQFMSLRRFSGFVLTFLFLFACFCVGARAQITPAAIASFATEVNHGTGITTLKNVGSIANIATDSFGDVLAVDDANGALYEFPAGNAPYVTLVGAGGLAGIGYPSGIATPGIAIDSSGNLYIEGGTCVLMYPFSSWGNLNTTLTSATPTSGACGNAFYSFGTGVQTWGIAIGNKSDPSLVVGTSQASGNGIASIAVTGAWATPVAGTITPIITGLKAPAISVAEDPAGNIYFVEQGTGALLGAYEIPAGQAGLTSDSGLKRIDPNLPDVTGVTVDSAGNIYISDQDSGVYLLSAGFSSSSAAVLLTPVYAQGSVGVTGNSGILFVPTAPSPVTGTPFEGIADVAEVTFNSAAFGAETVGTSKPAQESVNFSFNVMTTPGTIGVIEAGTSNPDFAVVGGNSADCTAGTAYDNTSSTSSSATCNVTVSFTPNKAGAVSATLAMLDGKGNLLASIPISGIGTSAAVQFSQLPQSTIGGGLVTPSQIAVDAAGNLYVADAGLGAVEKYPVGSGSGTAGTSVGTGLKAPTGVAVDGAGDVFIADSGSIYEVPQSASGLNTKGQVTLKTGLSLGLHVQLAADGLGNLFVSDADKQAVYELENFSAGWNTALPGVLSSQAVTLAGAAVSTPTAIAVDSYNNLYVVNGSSVYEVTPTGTQTNVLSGLTGVTGLAIDPSGSLYIAEAAGTIRVPYNPTGTPPLNLGNSTQVGTGVTNPISVVQDYLGNIYVADGSALNINMASASASIAFGTLTADPYPAPSAGSSTTQTAMLLNYGNAPLAVTGYSDTPDFSETSDTCSAAPIAINSTCNVIITFSAGIGDGGALTGEVLVQGNVGNSPVGVNGSGTAPVLAGSATAMTVATNGTIEGVPVAVTVAPSPANSQPLTGNVTLTITPGSNVPVTIPAPVLSFTLPTTNGAVQFNPTGLSIGTYTFTARYDGDATYIYEHSITSGSVSITTPVAVTMTQPPILELTPTGLPPVPLESYTLPCTAGSGSSCTTSYNYGQPSGNPPGYLVLGGDGAAGGGAQPTDGSPNQYLYTYSVSVAPTAAGFPLVGTAVYDSSNTASVSAFNSGTVNYEIAGGASLCGSEAGSTSIVPVVGDTGAAPIGVACAAVSTSNGTIPDIMTYASVTPVYTGTYSDLTSVNPNYTQVKGSTFGIWALRNPMVMISSNPATLTVAPGSSVSSTLTISSVMGYGYVGRNGTYQNYALPLDLQCQGLPAYATCSFGYPTPSATDPTFMTNPVGLECASSTAAAPAYCAIDVGPAPGSVNGYTQNHAGQTVPCDASDGCLGPGTLTMTIQTNVSPSASASRNAGNSGLELATLFGLGFLGLTFRRRGSRFGGYLMVVCLLLCGGAIAGITACSTKTLGSTSVTGVTPAGSYWVTVTAKETGSMIVTTNAGKSNAQSFTVYGNGNDISLPYTINVTVGN